MKIADLLFSVFNCCRKPSGDDDVVRRNNYTVVQPKTAVASTAKHHCIPFQQTHPGRCLTCIDNLRTRPRDRAHELTRYRSDSGQSLNKIQSNSFTCQQHIGKAYSAGNHLSGVNLLAIGDKGFELLLWIEGKKDFFGRFETGDN